MHEESEDEVDEEEEDNIQYANSIKVGRYTTLSVHYNNVKCNECCVAVDITRAYDLNG
jgi:hypothetical protein